MRANKIADILLGLFTWVLVPVQLVVSPILAITAMLTFGVILLPLSLLWIALLGPMLAVSWLGSKHYVARELLGFLFMPWVALAYAIASIVPSMGEVESRASKILLCEVWPFTWEFYQLMQGRLEQRCMYTSGLDSVIERLAIRDPIRHRTAARIIAGERLDAGLQ